MPDNTTPKKPMQEILDSIETGIKDLFASEKYAQYLRTMSKFHRYSLNNQMLIYMQRPDATLVAGYDKWQKQFGRNVKKGEKSIRIIAPTPYKKKIEQDKLDPDTKLPMRDADGNIIKEEKEIKIPMYKPVPVFDVAQTDGKPLPQLASDLTGNVQNYDVFLESLKRASPVPIAFEPLEVSTDGYFVPSEHRIAIRDNMSEVQTVSAALHEIAHAKLHDYEKLREADGFVNDNTEPIKPKDRRTEEVEAESISYAVCQHYGIETGDNSFGYIAQWSKDKELKVLKESLETISKTSSSLITDIDQHYREICKERGITAEHTPSTAPEQRISIHERLEQLKSKEQPQKTKTMRKSAERDTL